MLRSLDAEEIDLLTNNPDKADQLTKLGIRLRSVIPTGAHLNPNNYRYLRAKVAETHHTIKIDVDIEGVAL
jgi:GTP cyclohydrolase II